MSRATRAFVASTSAIFAVFHVIPALSQSATPKADADAAPRGRELQITITANRSETSIQRTGSAITVISADEIRKSNPGSLAEALRSVPGLDLTETGGPGGSTAVRLRGANAGQTLVLIDGMRVNDPSGSSGEFDFAALAPGLIDRIEVLRGPQSALYGSDAIGGVINIITKRGRGPFSAYGQVEGGSYGTYGANTGAHGTQGPWNYAFAFSTLKTDGFSRYGYRIGRAPGIAGKLENDGTTRHGAYGRIGYNAGTGLRFEIGSMATITKSDYDAAFGFQPDSQGRADTVFHSSFAKAELDTFDNRLKHSVQLFASRTKRDYRSFYTVNFPPPTDFFEKYQYIGTRVGAEYQGNLALDRFGSLIFGTRIEREAIESYSEFIAPFPTPRTKDVGKSQSTRSAFALWQVPLGERLDISLGGRIDDVVDTTIFRTWRATAAYRITETGTKLRASAGTGGKAPTLYQLHAPLYGVASLQPERSFGVDAGIDQTLFDGRVKLSATVFANRMKQMIDFEFNGAVCPGGLGVHPFGCYANIARAETSGVETAAEAVLWQDYLTLKATYTYLKARDRDTGLALARRPEHSGKAGLSITPYANWTIEPTLTFMGRRFSTTGQRERLAPYARLDALVNYRVNEHFDVYLRGENLTNARYQEVTNYGTTGRAVYAGMKTTW